MHTEHHCDSKQRNKAALSNLISIGTVSETCKFHVSEGSIVTPK